MKAKDDRAGPSTFKGCKDTSAGTRKREKTKVSSQKEEEGGARCLG